VFLDVMDKLSPEKRTWNMSRIKNKDTRPELRVRSLLHKFGYRFRLNRKDLIGCPDIVLPKHNKIIFVHGCFWHRHKGCKYAYNPKSRQEFWENKFDKNINRDHGVSNSLIELGWDVHVIWECQTKSEYDLETRIKGIFTCLDSI